MESCLLKRSKDNISAENEDLDQNYIYHEMKVGEYYDVKEFNPYWWNMVGNGEKYTVCGHIWDGDKNKKGSYSEFYACTEVGKHKMYGHDNHVYVKKVSSTCWRFECPECFRKASLKAALSIEDRFLRMPKHDPDYDGYFELDGGTCDADKIDYSGDNEYFINVQRRKPLDNAEDRSSHGKPVHYMVSLNRDDSEYIKSVEGFKFVKKRLISMLNSLGVNGGCIIFHPFRSDKETLPLDDEEEVVISIQNSDVDYAELKRYFDVIGEELVGWYISPHFHIIGYSKYGISSVKVAKNYHETGWIFRDLGIRDSVFGTALYQLSHAGYHKSFHTITWFGIMGYNGRSYLNRLGLYSNKKSEKKCKICSSGLKRYIVEASMNPVYGEPEGGYIIPTPDVEFIEVEKLKCEIQYESSDTIEGLDKFIYKPV